MKKVQKTGVLLLLGFLFASGFIFTTATAAEYKTADDWVKAARAEIKEVSVTEAQGMIQKTGQPLIILDVRDPYEFKKGHLPGAINISRGMLEFKVTKEIPNRDATILVYCKTGGRGALAAYTLKQMGYKNVLNLSGGWENWLEAGYPVE